MTNAAEDASASALGAQNEAALARQLPLHHQSAHIELRIIGAS